MTTTGSGGASAPAPRPRSIAHQTMAELGGPTSILVRQRDDHVELDRLITAARETLPTGGVTHQVTLRALARLVFTHAFAEEAVLFPAARRVLPEGDPLSLHIEEAHQDVDELVTRLDQSSSDDPEHPELLERTFGALQTDVRTEEDELLPRMQELLSPQQLRLLGWGWQILRRTSPTRAHPLVSRRPPGQTLSALPLTVLDRSRDRLQQLDELTGGRLRSVLTPADQVLAASAGAVERLPIMQRGERPETRQ